MKITSSEQYSSLLQEFKDALSKAIPYEQNCLVRFEQHPGVQMQYGPSAVMCCLETRDSGVDHYVIYINQGGYATFIRSVGG